MFLKVTRLKTLFQPQDDENTDKTDTMTINSKVTEKGHDSTLELHQSLLRSKTINEISLPIYFLNFKFL